MAEKSSTNQEKKEKTVRQRETTQEGQGPGYPSLSSLAPQALQRMAGLPPNRVDPADVLSLQSTVGNRAVQRMLQDAVSTPTVQRENGDETEAPPELLEALDKLDGIPSKKKHIMVPKHKWDLVVADPKTFKYADEAKDADADPDSWQQVKAIMKEVLTKGKQTAYKGTALQRQLTVKGEEVVVTYVNPKEKTFYVSDGWVVS